MDPAQINLDLFDLDNLDNMNSIDFGPYDATLSTLQPPTSTSTIESPSDTFLSASECADMILQTSQGAVDTFAATLSPSATEVTASTVSPTTAPDVETSTSLLSVGTLPLSATMALSLTSREQRQSSEISHPLAIVPVKPHPEGANGSMVVASLSSEFQTIVRQVSLTSTSDLLNADIHSLSGSLFPSPSSPLRAGHVPGSQGDPHGGFPPNSPTGLLYSQQHEQHGQQRKAIQQTVMQPQVQPQVQPQFRAQPRRNPQLLPLSILRLQQQQQQQQQQRDRVDRMVHHTDFGGYTTAARPQQLRHPQVIPHQLPQQESHQICAPLSSLSPALHPYPYSLSHSHPHPHPHSQHTHPHPYPPQVFPQPHSQMVQHQEFWSRQAQYHHHYHQQQQQQQQQSRHLPPFPYPHPLADASFQSLAPNQAMNVTQYLPPLPQQQVFQSNQGQPQMDMDYVGGAFSASDNGHQDLQTMSTLQHHQQQQQQQQFQATLLGPALSSLPSPVSATPPPGFATPFHGHPYQYHNQCMVGPRVLISDPNSHTPITLGDQLHHPPYEGSLVTTADEQHGRGSEVHTPASATQYVRTMKAEELAERLKHVREQKHKSTPPKPTPRQRQRRAQKQTQTQMQTPEEDLDHNLAPIKLCDSPLMAAQARILQTLSKVTAKAADSSLRFSGSQIPSPSTTPRSGASERCLATSSATILNPPYAHVSASESGHMETMDLPRDSEPEDEGRSTMEDSFMQENYEIQRPYNELHVSLHDIEGTGRGQVLSHSHDSYSSSSSSLGDDSRTVSPEPIHVGRKIKVEEGAVGHASKTLPRTSSYPRRADYEEFSGPVRVRRPKRSLAELYENGRRRSLGYSDDPEKDDVDIEGIIEEHPVHGEPSEKIEEYELEETESGGEADDSGSDYSETSPRRSRRQVQRRRASEKFAARASSATSSLGRKKTVVGTATRNKNRRQIQQRGQRRSLQTHKIVQLPTTVMTGSSSDLSSMPQLYAEYTREMKTQVLRAQALASGTYTLVGSSGDHSADVSPAGTSRDHASQYQSTDSQQGNNDSRNSNHNGSNGDIPCTFSSCPRTFISQGLLKSHLVSHFEDKPFWCDECSEDGVHPRESLPPLMPGMPPQVFEVKRYKRNHDLLRHKREQHPPVSVQISRAMEKIAARERRKEVTLQKSRERTEEKRKEEDDMEEEEGQKKTPRRKGRRYEDESKDLLKKIEASARAIETLESDRRAKKRCQPTDQPKEEADDEENSDGAENKAAVPQAQRRARKSKKE